MALMAVALEQETMAAWAAAEAAAVRRRQHKAPPLHISDGQEGPTPKAAEPEPEALLLLTPVLRALTEAEAEADTEPGVLDIPAVRAAQAAQE